MTLKPGTELGPYRIIKKIGSGASNIIYSVPKGKEVIALKVALEPVEEHDDFRERWSENNLWREHQIAKILGKHPNLVSIYGYSVYDGSSCLEMELVDGTSGVNPSIFDKPVYEKLEIIKQIAYALNHAHLRGIVHCDVKPENFLVDANNIAKLTDFGWSADFDLRLPQHPKKIVGTPGYTAPERFDENNEPIILDENHEPIIPTSMVDIYALGMSLYLMLTGQEYSRWAGPTLKLSRTRGVPKSIDRLFARAKRKNPKKRFPTAKAFAEEIEEVLVELSGS